MFYVVWESSNSINLMKQYKPLLKKEWPQNKLRTSGRIGTETYNFEGGKLLSPLKLSSHLLSS